MKILAVSSSGGHWIQLQRLKSQILDTYTTAYVGTNEGMKSSLCEYSNFYCVPDCNKSSIFAVFLCFTKIFSIIWKEKPNVIISTGAAPGVLAMIIGKVFSCKLIWIDSLANTKKMSLSGSLAKHIVDECFTQWEDVAYQHKKIKYKGNVI